MDASGLSLLLTALTGLVTALGVIYLGYISKRGATELKEQGQVLDKVEKQGNSVSLELKRTNMVYSRRVAVATGEDADVAIADDAQRVYEEAKESAERDEKKEP